MMMGFLAMPVDAHEELYCRPDDPAGRYREHPVDFTHLLLEVQFEPALGKVVGRAAYRFAAIQPKVDTLFLDGPGISFKKVLLDGKPIRTDSVSGGWILHFSPALIWNQAHTLQIDYSAFPEKGLYFIGWNDVTHRCRKQIWTQGQGIDNRHWFPAYDDVNDKLITETKIRFDTAYAVISNGPLKSKTVNKDGTATWHYAMSKPHVPYLVMLAIGKYAYKDIKSNSGITSRQYYYPDYAEAFEPTYQYSKEMMDWFHRELQVAYPWQTYANTPVQDFMYGAMENTGSTVFTDYYYRDVRSGIERSYVATNAHELAHQWFGDLITEWSGTHHWLHESFATYYAKHFGRAVYGEDYYQWKYREEANSAIAADERDHYPVAHTQGGSARHYPKGSYVIDMLRYVVGDSVFRETITYYLKKHAHGNVDTHDFWRAFMEKAGINLDWFFDEWIYRAGYPKMEVSKKVWGDTLQLDVVQKRDSMSLTAYFKMPVQALLAYEDGSFDTLKFWMMDSLSRVRTVLPVSKVLSYVVVDPGSRILKEMTYPRTRDELIRTALNAPSLLDRYDATVQLRDSSWEEKEFFIKEAWVNARHFSIKNELLNHLDSRPESGTKKGLFNVAARDKDEEVRLHVIQLADSTKPYLLEYLKPLLFDSSYVNIERAMRKLQRYRPDTWQEIKSATYNVMGISANVRCTLIELEIKQGDTTRIKELLDYAGPSFEFRTRINAMESIQKLKWGGSEALSVLMPTAVHFNSRLSSVAKSVLKTLLKDRKNLDTFKTLLETGSWTNAQRTALEALIK